MKKNSIELSKEQREGLEQLVSKGKASARTVLKMRSIVVDNQNGLRSESWMESKRRI